MASEESKANMRRIPLEIFNQGNLAVVDEVVAPDYIEHALPSGFPSGLEGLKVFVSAVRAAFPDYHYTIDDEVTEGDTVVQRLTARGTMTGGFMGMPATGKSASWTEIHIARVANGKLTEHWANIDQLGMLHQLGVIPIPG